MPYPQQPTGAEDQANSGGASFGVSSSPRFPEIEQQVLEFWRRDDTFRESIRQREGAPEWVFNDGPPFANGLPHYGHLLTGYAKDVFPRFQTMRGKKVERRFGWDTHGLPAELEVMKQLGITEKSQIEEMGIDVFNRKARESVLFYTREWQEYVTRQARWVDFENDYKTLNLGFMESVLWAFKQLHDRGLAYEGHRVLPYCWRDETPLSNHELRMDDDVYQMRQDPSVTVTFPLTGAKAELFDLAGVRALAWTTTPWTLPTNLALAVGPDIEYAVVPEGPLDAADGGPEQARYLIAVDLAGNYAKDLGYESAEALHEAVERTIAGSVLSGMRYEALFGYFDDAERWGTEDAWQILADDYVTTSDGTGIVHQAPAYGEDDMRVASAAGIPTIMSLDDGGRFLSAVTDVAGELWSDANRPLIRLIRDRGRLLREQSYEHSYPHCWRCRNPLIYKAVSSWFVRVTEIKERLLEVNEEITWVPGNVKHGQFGKWLEGARDWSVSRNRYWGSPIPVWKSDNPEYPRVDVYGSLTELERDFGELPVNPETGEVDLHRPYIDELTRPNPDDPTGRSTMRRIEDVFDVWFDSGSMPFAQAHYPFENREWFDTHQPADFIVEYIGQTRGWFYVMHVLATALFDRPAFKNVISHGIVLGSDGNKMSKSLQNYPDVNEVFDRDGSDAMRWFLMASPVVRGGNLIVTEEGIREGVRQFILPLWNTWYFFSLYANADGLLATRSTNSQDPLDRYILAKTGQLVREVAAHLDGLDTTSAAESLRAFAEVLTNWYVRRSRDRFWEGVSGENGRPENQQAFDTLFTVLETLSRVAAPMSPLITEELWRGLTGGRSVHLEEWPDANEFPVEDELVAAMDEVRQITSQALALRKARRLRVRLPLAELTVVTSRPTALEPFVDILREELNVKTVRLVQQTDSSAEDHGIVHSLTVNARAAGPRLGKQVQQAIKGAKSGDWSETDGTVVAGGIELEPHEYELTLRVGDDGAADAALALLPGGGFVLLDTVTTPELEAEGVARDAIRAVQEARKQAGLDVSDRIVLALNATPEHASALERHADLIAAETLAVGFAVAESAELDTVIEHLASPGDGVHVSASSAIGPEKASIVITIDATEAASARTGATA
ncbi:MAG: isoleucine--tRNA ligase [Leucobacter sp.]